MYYSLFCFCRPIRHHYYPSCSFNWSTSFIRLPLAPLSLASPVLLPLTHTLHLNSNCSVADDKYITLLLSLPCCIVHSTSTIVSQLLRDPAPLFQPLHGILLLYTFQFLSNQLHKSSAFCFVHAHSSCRHGFPTWIPLAPTPRKPSPWNMRT